MGGRVVTHRVVTPRSAALVAAAGAVVWRVGFSPSSQLAGAFPWRGAGTDRRIALTFDDGPNEPYTSRIADTLADRGVTASFFCVGRCVQRHPAVVRRLVADGHLVGNHSLSHRFSRYLTAPDYRREIIETQQVIADTAGVRPGCFRPPWLFRHPLLLRTVRELGLQVVSGQFAHALEVAQPPADRLVAGALARARPGAILIFHDGFDGRGGDRAQTAAAVGPLIDALRGRGYRFMGVDQLLGVPGYLDGPAPADPISP